MTAVRAPLQVGVKTFPVIEIFGPTIQGEGHLAGAPTYFVRFGGCDYRCSWCDSMYAVDPALVRLNAKRLTALQIAATISRLTHGPEWVTFSGGNPALLDLGDLVGILHDRNRLVSVETQGSRWKDWLGDVDHLTISPKPPSSEMATRRNAAETSEFLARANRMPVARRSLKFVVFDQDDYDWARDVTLGLPRGDWPLVYLSVGTDQGDDDATTRRLIEQRYAWLCEKVAHDGRLAERVRVFPQLHVLAWGTARGV